MHLSSTQSGLIPPLIPISFSSALRQLFWQPVRPNLNLCGNSIAKNLSLISFAREYVSIQPLGQIALPWHAVTVLTLAPHTPGSQLPSARAALTSSISSSFIKGISTPCLDVRWTYPSPYFSETSAIVASCFASKWPPTDFNLKEKQFFCFWRIKPPFFKVL